MGEMNPSIRYRYRYDEMRCDSIHPMSIEENERRGRKERKGEPRAGQISKIRSKVENSALSHQQMVTWAETWGS